MDLILGHNQFIGISHTSEERGIELNKRFFDVKNIYDVVESAANIGCRDMMVETHPKMLEFLDYYKESRTFDMNFYIQVPYVHGYIDRMNDKGLSGLFLDLVRRDGIKAISSIAVKDALSLAKGDYLSIATSILQLEVGPFMDVEIKGLFLHNVSTDLLLSLELSEAFSQYLEYVKDEMQLKPGFITLNFPRFKTKMEEWDLGAPPVMTPVNLKGFDMNPSREQVESSIGCYAGYIAAMNILGGGAYSVEEAGNYLTSMRNIKSCVVGASSGEHIRQLMAVLSKQGNNYQRISSPYKVIN